MFALQIVVCVFNTCLKVNYEVQFDGPWNQSENYDMSNSMRLIRKGFSFENQRSAKQKPALPRLNT